jgi:hypothetical protein
MGFCLYHGLEVVPAKSALLLQVAFATNSQYAAHLCSGALSRGARHTFAMPAG